jgi:predicted nucleic acid-binding protein
VAKSDRHGNVLVDSGGWIALLSARDQHHVEADELFRHAIRERVPLMTTNLVLAEVHRLLLFRAGIRAAATALDRIAASSRVRIVFATAAHHAAARAWIARLDDQRITYTDAVSFALMKAMPCTAVLGFDRDFAVAGFPFWTAT